MSWPAGDVIFPGLGADYEFVRLIGRGGTGWVALVRHIPLDRWEAVKTVRSGTRQLAAVRRLEREGRVLARLNHPGIVAVYRLLTSPTSVGLVMEYLPGGDLQNAMDHGRLSGSQRVRVLSQVADALTAAASAGVVHRDVKPSNVLLDSAGRAVLADFGLARLPRDPGAFRTMSGLVTGTPLFMAPEQIERPDDDLPGVDSYAFGVLAYRLLTDHWPYPTTSIAEVINAHRHLEPTPPWEHNPELPRQAAESLIAALTKDPALRMRPEMLIGRLHQTSDHDWDVLVGKISRPAGPAKEVPPATPETGAGSIGETVAELPSRTEPDPDRTDPTRTQAEASDSLSPDGGAQHTSWIRPDLPAPGADQIRVQPVVFRVRRRLRRQTVARLVGVLVGLLLGLTIYFLLTAG